MTKHTPPMNSAELKYYLEHHLANEVSWLLRAATEWHVQKELKLKINGYHVQVYAMDSTFLHARTLFEFFTKQTSNNYYGCSIYGIPVIASTLYTNDWVEVLHSYMMHAQDRSSPRQLTSYSSTSNMKHLNEMPVDFAMEVVRLWHQFVGLLSSSSNPDIQALSRIADNILNEAINATRIINDSSYTKKGSVPLIVW